MIHFNFYKTRFANAGMHLHEDFFEQAKQQCVCENAVELNKRIDFIKYRDRGFSLCKAIRYSDGTTVKVINKKNYRRSISIPDFVDYRNDIIIDLKTIHFTKVPDKGGIFITQSIYSTIPSGYENATEDFKKNLEASCSRKYKEQFERYKLAYLKATNRIAALHIYLIPYAKIN
jgi:hypothetical protein